MGSSGDFILFDSVFNLIHTWWRNKMTYFCLPNCNLTTSYIQSTYISFIKRYSVRNTKQSMCSSLNIDKSGRTRKSLLTCEYGEFKRFPYDVRRTKTCKAERGMTRRFNADPRKVDGAVRWLSRSATPITGLTACNSMSAGQPAKIYASVFILQWKDL